METKPNASRSRWTGQLILWIALMASSVPVYAAARLEAQRALAVQTVASLAGVAVKEVACSDTPVPLSPDGWSLSCRVGGHMIAIRLFPQRGSLLAVWDDSKPGGPVGDVTQQAALAQALALVSRRFGNDVRKMRMFQNVLIRSGLYSFAWRKQLDSATATGDVAVIRVRKAGGAVLCYSERRPAHGIDRKDVRVTRREATDIGARLLTPAGHFRLVRALLVLSSAISPGQGPVWQLAYEPTDRQEDDAWPMLIIDAVTGKELTAHRGVAQ